MKHFFDTLLLALDDVSFAKYLAMMLVGTFISLATYYVANGNEAMSGFTTHALFFPGFVLFYSGFGGIVATLSSQYRKP